MTRPLLKLFIILLAVLVAACAPMAPAPTGDSWPLPPDSRPEPSPEAKKIPEETTPPITSGKTRELSAAVQSLLDQGWASYRQDDFQGALVFSERAQRIDSRSPEVYLLMASAQFSLYKLNVAEQLTRKGLALSTSGTSVYRQLQALLGRISRAGAP